MKLYLLIITAIIGFQSNANSQSDSLQVTGEIGIRGKWQTGNFAQFVVHPSGKLAIEKKHTRVEVQANYEFLKVNSGSLINDFWTYGIYQYQSRRTIFPMAMVHYGFAQAYAIDHSLIGGLGVGINAFGKNEHLYLQAHIYTGYLDLKYDFTPTHKAPSLGSFVRLHIPLKKDLIYGILDSHAYLSLKDNNYRSINGRFIMLFHLLHNLGMNVTYSILYTNNNPFVSCKMNGNLTFGLTYTFK